MPRQFSYINPAALGMVRNVVDPWWRMRAPLPVSGPSPVYHFEDRQRELDQAGAANLHSTFQEALAMEQHRATQEMARIHYQLESAKLQSEVAQMRAKAEREMKFEAMREKAVPEIYSIDPAAKDAHDQVARVLKEHPQLGADAVFLSHLDHVKTAIEGARKFSDAQDFKTQFENLKNQNSLERQKEMADVRSGHAKELADLRAQHALELKTASGPSDKVKTTYQQAVADSANYQRQVDETQKLIDEQEAKPELDTDSEKHLQNMVKSQNAWRSKLDRANATKDALELVHPQLNPSAQTAPDASSATPTSDAATQSAPAKEAPAATPPPANPVIAPVAQTPDNPAIAAPTTTEKKRPSLEELSPYTQGGS